jgi:hypothetical protein
MHCSSGDRGDALALREEDAVKDQNPAEALVGRMGEPFTFVVERGKVAEFARATGSTDQAHFDGPAPVSPPTFLMASAHWASEESNALYGVPIDMTTALHGGQEFVFYGAPPGAGTELCAQMRIESRYVKVNKSRGDMTFTVTVTEFRGTDGVLVAESRMTGIEMGEVPPCQ